MLGILCFIVLLMFVTVVQVWKTEVILFLLKAQLMFADGVHRNSTNLYLQMRFSLRNYNMLGMQQ